MPKVLYVVFWLENNCQNNVWNMSNIEKAHWRKMLEPGEMFPKSQRSKPCSPRTVSDTSWAIWCKRHLSKVLSAPSESGHFYSNFFCPILSSKRGDLVTGVTLDSQEDIFYWSVSDPSFHSVNPISNFTQDTEDKGTSPRLPLSQVHIFLDIIILDAHVCKDYEKSFL